MPPPSWRARRARGRPRWGCISSTRGRGRASRGSTSASASRPPPSSPPPTGWAWACARPPRGGGLTFVWQLPAEEPLDALAERLLAAVARQGARRLVVDGLDILAQRARRDARLVHFWAALQEELRARGVTTLATLRLPEFFGPASAVPIAGLDGLFDTLLFLRTVELGSPLYRLVSTLKARGRDTDRAIREFQLTPAGIVLAETSTGAEAIMGGTPPEDGDGADTAGR